MLTRERGHGIRVRQYISGKFITLAVFALLQCFIYLAIGNAILEIREMFWTYLGWMLITALTGVAIGLLISSIVRDSKTALNIIPLVLIPQIILGGALIKYEEMNHNLDVVFSIRKWLTKNGEALPEKPSALKVPLLCELMPLRWSYESIVLTQDTLNPLTHIISEIEDEKKLLLVKPDLDNDGISDLDDQELEKLDKLKEAQAVIFSLEAENYRDLKGYLEKIRQDLRAGKFNPEEIPLPAGSNTVSLMDAYQNQRIRDLVAKAEIETEDYRLYEGNPGQRQPNVFLGHSKTYFGMEIPTLPTNLLAMFAFITISLSALAVNLRRQLRRVQ